MSDVFVSYSSEDRDRVEPLVRELESEGLSVWWDPRIDVGAAFDRQIEHQLDIASCVVVVWSKHSVESEWVREEAQDGLDRNALFPVQIDECRLPIGFRRIQTAQLIGWPQRRETEAEVCAGIRSIVDGRRTLDTPQAAPQPVGVPEEGQAFRPPDEQRRWSPFVWIAAVAVAGIALIFVLNTSSLLKM